MSVTSSDDEAIKRNHRAMWALGDYPAVATEVISELGAIVADEARIQQGERVLDIAAGSGNAAIPAALAGGRVVASDLTPQMFEAGRSRADEAGVTIVWDEADAENLPYPDDTFDVALSCVGIMFAPLHETAARELTRVVKPAGRFVLANWTPEGFIGQMFAAMRPYAAPPPEGASPPPLWGHEDHVRALFENRVESLRFERRSLTVDRFPDPAAWLEFFKQAYGPTIALFDRVSHEGEDRSADLDRALLSVAEQHFTDGQMQWEYALISATVV